MDEHGNYKLSEGVIKEIIEGDYEGEPILQVIKIKIILSQSVDGKPAPSRYRLIVSDGVNFQHALLTTQHSDSVVEGNIDRNSIIRLQNFLVQTVQDKKFIILIKIDRLGMAPGKIGDPVQLDSVPNPVSVPVTGTTTTTVDVKPRVPQLQQQQPLQPQMYQRNTATTSLNTSSHNEMASMRKIGPSTNTIQEVVPISSLNPYHGFRIKARVTSRSDIRTWNNDRGGGRLFNVELIDESGEIKVSAFNDEVSKWYDILEPNKVFYFSGGKVQPARKKFSNLPHDYEIVLQSTSVIEPVPEDDALPKITFNFQTISDIENAELNSMVNVIGMVERSGNLSEIIRRNGEPVKKRDITLVDQSLKSVRMTLWGDRAEQWNDNRAVIAIKGAKVGEFQGKTLSLSNSSQMIIDPDIPVAHQLRGWWDTQGQNQTFSNLGGSSGNSFDAPSTSIDTRKTFADIDNERMGQEGDVKPYITVMARITQIPHDRTIAYPADPDNGTKLTQQGNNEWFSEKKQCVVPNVEWRYILSANTTDHTGTRRVTIFNDQAKPLMGISAEELLLLKENDDAQYERAFSNVIMKQCLLRIRISKESYNDQERLRLTAVSVTPVDFSSENILLENAIKAYSEKGFAIGNIPSPETELFGI